MSSEDTVKSEKTGPGTSTNTLFSVKESCRLRNLTNRSKERLKTKKYG